VTTIQYATLYALYSRLHRTLVRAQEERPLRDEFVDGELEWVTYERETMHTAVNEARAELGYQPVDVTAIERAEQSAGGHFDYTKKYALYCAELALKEQQ
jgi:phosphopantetheine adenylyltransferase